MQRQTPSKFAAIVAAAIAVAAQWDVQAESHFSAVLPPAPAPKALAAAEMQLPPRPAREIALGELPPARVAAIREANSADATKAAQVGVVRDLPSPASRADWRPVPGGMAARWIVRASGAREIRVRLEARGAAAGVRARFASPAPGSTLHEEILEGPGPLWGPLIRGDAVVVELFAPGAPAPADLDIAPVQVAHHFESLARASVAPKQLAMPCQSDLICEAGADPVLARAGAASLKIGWVDADGHAAYACSATLLNPADGSFRPYIYTAAHCIDDEASARNVVAHWFYETSRCGGDDVRAEAVTVGGGAQLLASDRALDASFLRLNRMPPPGVTFAGWNSQPPAPGEPVTALHHANGEGTKVSHATVMPPPPYEFLAVAWTSGIVQGGSSGSGLFTRTDSPVPDLLFRGGLASGNSSCEAPGFALYSRIDKFWPKIAPYLSTSAESANATGLWFDPAEPGWGLSLAQQGDTVFAVLFIHGDDGRPTWLVAPAMRGAPGGAFTGTAYRTKGSALGAASSSPIESQALGTLEVRLSRAGNAELSVVLDGKPVATRRLSKQVFGSSAPVCVTSGQASRSSAVNYQDLWWDPEEPGWGLALAHQDDILFATLFTYDGSGAATWYVGPGVMRQADGRFRGTLFRTARAANAKSAWPASDATEAGQVELSFSDGETGVATITLPGGKVTRRITRQVFGAAATVCR